jgi:hypothetical protein
LELVGPPGVENQAPPGVGGFINCTKWLDEQGERAVPWDNLGNALPRPRGELGTKGQLHGLVSLPTGVAGAYGWAKGEAWFGHLELASNDDSCRGIEGAEATVPDRSC